MGRALFSETYNSSPAVRSEPEPAITSYDKWSVWNRFDPDSDEFFSNAEYEAFVDPVPFRDQAEEPSLALDSDNTSSTSSDSSGSDRGSPMVTGSDDPSAFVTHEYTSNEWETHFPFASSAPGPRWRIVDEPAEIRGYTQMTRIPVYQPRTDAPGDSPRRVDRPRSATVSSAPSVHIPSALRHSAIATDLDFEVTPLPSPTHIRRTVHITPIDIPIEPSTPSPISPDSPSTPPPVMYSHPQMTPSPAPTVTPRIYSWDRNPPASPTSPSPFQGVGPLTNPSARMSLTRLPARSRIHNF